VGLGVWVKLLGGPWTRALDRGATDDSSRVCRPPTFATTSRSGSPMPSNYAVPLSNTWDSWEQTSAGNRSIPAGCNTLSFAAGLLNYIRSDRPAVHTVPVSRRDVGDFLATISFGCFDMSVDTRTSDVRNHPVGNSFRISHAHSARPWLWMAGRCPRGGSLDALLLGDGINHGHETEHGWLAAAMVHLWVCPQ